MASWPLPSMAVYYILEAILCVYGYNNILVAWNHM
jgi:hypothetical protein